MSFLGFYLVSTSMAFGSREGVALVGDGVWNAMGVRDECCFAMVAVKRRWLRNRSIFSYYPFVVIGTVSMP